MKIRLILLTFVVGFNFGCTGKRDTITIQPLKPNNSAFSAKLVKSIPLSHQNEVAIGSIDKLLVFNDRIYVFDRNQGNGLLILSETGKLLRKIPLGRGPGELINPMGFNCIDNQLIIYDAPGQSLFRYYTLDGDYLHTKALPTGWVAYSFERYDDETLLIQGSTDSLIRQDTSKVYKYHVIDRKFSKCYRSFLQTTDGMIRLSETRPISYYDGKFLLLARPLNYIYEFDDKNLSKKYFIDFGSLNYLESDLSQGYQHILSLFRESRRIGLLDHIYENQTLVYFTYANFDKGADVPVIFSKSTHESANFDEVLANSGLPAVELHQTTGNELICLFSPGNFDEADVEKFVAAGLLPAGTTPDSNPVICIIQISAIKRDRD